MGADWAQVVDDFASGCESYLVRLFFLQSDIGNKTGVGSLANFWYGVPWDEVDGVGSSLAVVIDALVEAV